MKPLCRALTSVGFVGSFGSSANEQMMFLCCQEIMRFEKAQGSKQQGEEELADSC